MVIIAIDLGFSWFTIFYILYILHRSRVLANCIQVLLFEDGTVQLVSVGAPQAFLYLVFGDHKVTLIPLWFFLDLWYWCASSDIDCFSCWRACVWVHSWCGLLLSIGMSLVLVGPTQSVEVCIDLAFFGLLSFWILFIMYAIGPLVESIQALSSKEGTVQLAWVLVHLRPLICCIWWSRGYFDRFLIFSGFILSIRMFRCHLFRASLFVSP